MFFVLKRMASKQQLIRLATAEGPAVLPLARRHGGVRKRRREGRRDGLGRRGPPRLPPCFLELQHGSVLSLRLAARRLDEVMPSKRTGPASDKGELGFASLRQAVRETHVNFLTARGKDRPQRVTMNITESS